jgi:Ca2+-binding RTX toxin-like protein
MARFIPQLRHRASHSDHHWQPSLEALEDRCVPAVSVMDGVLVIKGTAGGDVVTVSTGYQPGGILAVVSLNSSVTTHTGTINSISFEGLEGNDSLEVSYNVLPVKANGVGGQDTLRIIEHELGGPDHSMSGGSGNDYILGGWGNDTLRGNGGRDTLVGEMGDDVLYGGTGNDRLYGNVGTYTRGDRLYGNSGNDYLDGGQGDTLPDLLVGGSGADRFVKDLVWNGSKFVNKDKGYDFKASEGDRYVDPGLLAALAATDHDQLGW